MLLEPRRVSPRCGMKDCEEEAEYVCDVQVHDADRLKTAGDRGARGLLCNRRVCVYHAILAGGDFHLCDVCYSNALRIERHRQKVEAQTTGNGKNFEVAC